MGKLIQRNGKLVLDTNYPMTHKINKKILRAYLNKSATAYHRNRLGEMFENRTKVGVRTQIVRYFDKTKELPKKHINDKTEYQRTNQTKVIKHYR